MVFNAVGSHPVLKKRGLVDSFRTADNRHLLMTCMTSGCVVYDELVDCFLGFAQWLVDPGNPLVGLRNCIVAPHIASATVSSRNGMAEIAADNLIAGLKGEPLRAWVNPEAAANRRTST